MADTTSDQWLMEVEYAPLSPQNAPVAWKHQIIDDVMGVNFVTPSTMC